MKTYQVILAKAYTVTIDASDEERAKRFAEFYTGDIQDISTDKDRKGDSFSIEKIECSMNEGFDVKEISNS